MKTQFKSFTADTLSFIWTMNLFVFLFRTSLVDQSPTQEIHFFIFTSISFFLISVVLFPFLQKRFHSLGFLLYGSKNEVLRPYSRALWFWQILALSAVSLTVGIKISEFSLEFLDLEGFQSMSGLLRGLIQPELSIVGIAIIKVFETLFIALIATFLSIPLALFFSLLASRNLMSSKVGYPIYFIVRVFLNLIRSVEPIIWAIIFAVWVGIGPFAGMLALMVQSVVSLTKQFSEIIESSEDSLMECLEACGANRIQIIWFGLLPLVTLPFISYTIYRWDTNLRMATIIGFAGGGGIGTLLYQYSMRAQWSQVSAVIMVIALMVTLIDWLSSEIRDAIK